MRHLANQANLVLLKVAAFPSSAKYKKDNNYVRETRTNESTQFAEYLTVKKKNNQNINQNQVIC